MGSPSTILDPGRLLLPKQASPLGLDPLHLVIPEKTKIPSAPPSVDTAAASAAARKKTRIAALGRKGRASTVLSGGAGLTGSTPLSRPQALGA